MKRFLLRRMDQVRSATVVLHGYFSRRQGAGISFEIETTILFCLSSEKLGRQGAGFSFEIETYDIFEVHIFLEESPGGWHLIRD